jgi:hypothetical protein
VIVQTDADRSGEPTAMHFRPGYLTRFLTWVGTLPGDGWWFFAAIYTALVAWGHGVLWMTGRLQPGSLEPSFLTLGIYGPYSLAALALGTRIALQSLATFWPATGWPDADRAGWAFEFRHTPAAYTIPASLLGLAFALGALLGLPESVLGPESGRLSAYVAYAPTVLFGYGLMVIVGVQVFRWLWLVARIHREAEAIDPFDRAPVFAFSRLTVAVGLSYVAAAYYSLTVTAAFQAGNLASLIAIVVVTFSGIVAFVAPLWGIHGHLVQLKAARVRDVERRIDLVAAELFRRIEAGAFDSVKEVTDTLPGVTALRDRVAHLPTWPWPPQLLRGFVSALLLPVVLYVLTRAIGSQLGS